ncbi:MAG: VWA domain-containing protein [Planctomycetaceae bacterium]
MKGIIAFFRRLVPRPHRPVRWQAGIPLVLFLSLFALIVFSILPTFIITSANPSLWNHKNHLIRFPFLANWGVGFPQFELVRELEFARPWMFLLLLLTPWIWWMQAAGHAGLPYRRGMMAAFIRLCLCGLLIVVLAEPRAVRTSDVVSVVYNVDVSDSVNQFRGKMLEFVADTAAKKPGSDQAGLVVFGRTAAVEYPPKETFPFEKFINSQVSQDATNLEQSLALSAAMLPEENLGRIVLLSDGTETVGQLKDVIDDLQARGVEVNVAAADYEYEKEVLLERLDLPRFVRLGETYEASVVLQSLAAGKGTLVLMDGEKKIAEREVQFEAGKSRYSFPIKVDQPGYYEYSARIEVNPADDRRVENNVVRNYLYLDGPGRILIVTNPESSDEETRFLQLALKQGEREVEVINAQEFPYDPMNLMPYDAVIFADVAEDTLLQTQIQAMHDAIKNLGVGFLMVGGPNSFGPGGWQGSVIEDALPISMEITNKKILPKGALAIILHTCEFPSGNTWAKRITKRAIQVLNSEDLVGVMAQTMNGDEWIFELTPASKYSELATKINNAQIGDMGTFGTTMQMGYDALVKSDASTRHMIIISDGDAQAPVPSLIQKFQEAQISVSTVAVFPHNGDATTLKEIAALTKGRFHFPSDPNQLPSIFVKEAKTLRRSQLQNRKFVPEMMAPDAMLREIESSPDLYGYVLTSPKDDPRATIVLAAPPTETEVAAGDGERDPILAVWRYGLGVTAAYTADFTNRWGKDWVRWEQFQQMVNQIVTRISRTRREQFLRVYTYVNGNEGVVVVEDFHPEETLLDINVSVTGPNEFEQTQPVRQIAPRRYQTSMPLKGEGRYQVMIGASDGKRNETAYAGFIVSYSPEYLRFRADPIVLKEIAEATGGNEIDLNQEPEQIAEQLYGNRKPRRSSRAIFEWFLMLFALLLPLDVAVRRVQMDAGWFLRLFRREKKESAATIGALLQRAEAVRSNMNAQKEGTDGPRAPLPEGRPMPVRTQNRPTAQPTSGTTKPQPQTESSGSATPASAQGDADATTSRLLALKKKREEGKSQ